MVFQESLHVRDSETVAGTCVAAVAAFDSINNQTALQYSVQPEAALRRNEVDIPGLIVVDTYDGRTKPFLQFEDTVYSFVADAMRMVWPQLEALGVHHDVSITMAPDRQQNSRTTNLQVVTIDRGVQIELGGEQYTVDPAELTASGLMIAYYMLRQAKMREDQGGAFHPQPLRAKPGKS